MHCTCYLPSSVSVLFRIIVSAYQRWLPLNSKSQPIMFYLVDDDDSSFYVGCLNICESVRSTEILPPNAVRTDGLDIRLCWYVVSC